jgi:hypothetical protein
VEQVKAEITGTDLKDNEKNALETFYKDFLAVYETIIGEKLIPKKDKDGKNLPIDLSDIKTNIKYKFSA